MTIDTTPETDVPAREIPAGRCPYCERPFRDERRLYLHLEEVHEAAMDPEERERADDARALERDDLFLYQLKVAIALGLLYASSALVAMFLLG